MFLPLTAQAATFTTRKFKSINELQHALLEVKQLDMPQDGEVTDMKVDPTRAKVLVENLSHIKSRVQAANKGGREVSSSVNAWCLLGVCSAINLMCWMC